MRVAPELWDALFDQLELGIAIWRLEDLDDDGSLVLVRSNPAATRALGIPFEQRWGMRFAEVFPSTTREHCKSYADVVRQASPLVLCEFGGDRGDEVQFDVHAYPLVDQHLCIVFANISELEKARKQAVHHGKFLDSILEHIPAMVFVKDAKHLRFERMNRAGEELLGMSRESLVGKDDYAFFPPAQAAFFQSADRETLRGGEILEIPEESIQTREGQRWLYTRKIPIAGSNGPEHLLGVSIDITTRKRAQLALERAEANFRTLVEHCPDAIFAQRSGRIAFANPAFVRLLGFGPRDDVIGRPVESILHPDDLALPNSQRFARGVDAYPAMELRCVQRSGEVIDVEATGVSCEFDGESAIVSVLRDVTVRRRAEASLRESQEELERRVEHRTAELLRARAVLQQEVDTRGRAEAALQQRDEQLRQAQK
ncbi:MAG TPA: PAS domain S-box protein, partial [Polyangiales bacterium]|nr:PAS domain S-box protein [Polyangiales bacterium]